MQPFPIPVSVHDQVRVPSVADASLTYLCRPMINRDQPASNLYNRMISRKRDPLIRKMREMILTYDFGEHYDARSKSRIKELVEALLAEAMGIEDEDLQFLSDVESTILNECPEYFELALRDEELAYDLRLFNVSAFLYGVERKKETHFFPPGNLQERHDYLRDHVDPRDVLQLVLAGSNMLHPSVDIVKNSAPLSTSDSDLTSSDNTERDPISEDSGA